MKRIPAVLLAVALLLCPTCAAAETPKVSAASAILMEASTGRVLWEKDAHTPRLIASTTKLMTALVAVEHTPDLQKTVTVKHSHMAEGSSMYLRPGEEITLEALLYGLLLVSGNDAALALAEGCAGSVETFVGWMNEKAQELGMTDSRFANPNGLDAEGHGSSAYDLALLGREVLKNDVLAGMVGAKSVHIAGRSLRNHNKLLWRCEGCVGLKTGYTEAAGRTLVSAAVREGMTLVCVTLKAPDDWNDHQTLYNYGFSGWRMYPLTRAGKVLALLPTTGGIIPAVEAATGEVVAYPLTREERPTARLELPERLDAPVRKGARVGELQFYLNGEAIGSASLVCGAEVPRNAVPQRKGFLSWLFRRNAEKGVMDHGGTPAKAALRRRSLLTSGGREPHHSGSGDGERSPGLAGRSG